MKYYSYIQIILFIFALSGNAYASAKSDFEKGVTSFKSENYSTAIKSFRQAEKKGLKSASLYFNLGSSYYKNKQYKQSVIFFKKLSDYPAMRAIAAFNIGLADKQMNRKKSAEKQFIWVIKNSNNKKLTTLARQQIKNIKGKKSIRKNSKAWSSYASLALGNDSNISVAPSGTALERSDSFATIFLKTSKLLTGSKSNGWQAGADFYRFSYSTYNANSSTQYGAFIKKALKISDWKSKLITRLSKSTYGGSSYQTNLMLEAAGIKKLSKNNRFKLRFRYYDINSDNTVYDYLQGSKQQFRTELKRNTDNFKQRFYYELETNSRQDTATVSYSPTRHTLRAIHTIKTSRDIDWGGELSYRQSNYPVIASGSRDSTRWKYGLFAMYRFDKTTKLKARFVYTDNSSDSVIYDYDKNIISLNLSKLF